MVHYVKISRGLMTTCKFLWNVRAHLEQTRKNCDW